MSHVVVQILVENVVISSTTARNPDELENLVKDFISRAIDGKFYSHLTWMNKSSSVRIDKSNCRSYYIVWQSRELRSVSLNAVEGREIEKPRIDLGEIKNFLSERVEFRTQANDSGLGARNFNSNTNNTNIVHHNKIIDSIIQSKPFNGSVITREYSITPSEKQVVRCSESDYQAHYDYRNKHDDNQHISEDTDASEIDNFFSAAAEARFPVYGLANVAVGGGYSYRSSKLTEKKRYKATVSIMYEGGSFTINKTNICNNIACVRAEACSCILKKDFVVDKEFLRHAVDMLDKLEINPDSFETEYECFKNRFGHVFINTRVIGIKGSLTINISSDNDIDFSSHKGVLSAKVNTLTAGGSVDITGSGATRKTSIRFNSTSSWKSFGGSPITDMSKPRDILNGLDSSNWVLIKAEEYIPIFDLLPNKIKHGIYKHYYKNVDKDKNFLTFKLSNGDVYDPSTSNMISTNPVLVVKLCFEDGVYSGEFTVNVTINPYSFLTLTLTLIAIIYVTKNPTPDFERYCSGFLNKGKLDGFGIFNYKSGDIYYGMWSNNKYHGHGCYVYSNGASYSGEWRDGKKHGTGSESNPDGASYTGEWRDDKKHGTGTYSHPSGASYTGEWKNEKYNGTGTYIYPSGATYTGMWKDCKEHGSGTYTNPDGSSYTCEWRDGKKHDIRT